MSHTPHELHDEFPGAKDAIHALKQKDGHFTRLAAKYHDTNREIHRIEAEVEAASDERLEQLKKRRLAILDDISGQLRKYGAAS